MVEWQVNDEKARGVIKVLSRNLFDRTEETHERNFFIIPGVPTEMWNEHLPNTSTYHYRHANQFCPIGLCFTEQGPLLP
jgi:hypothetical protein